jgi:hypothetical protein
MITPPALRGTAILESGALAYRRRVITNIFRMQVLPWWLHFPSIKKRGGSTSGFLANYGSKPIDIGGLGHDYQSGILWSAYPIKLWALGPPSVSSSDAEKARRNPPTRGASPPGASDPQEKRGALPVHCKNGNAI